MPLKDKFTSLARLPASAAALLALAIVSWSTVASAQTVRAPQIVGDQINSFAPIGTGVAAQQGTFIELTDAAKRAMKKVTELFASGRVEPVPAEELKQLNLSVSSVALRFRVGMFVEYVTSNMLRLYTMSRSVNTCAPEFQKVAQVVEKELEQLANVQKGRRNGAVFGRNAVADMKVGCP